jgi:hypothetical protein
MEENRTAVQQWMHAKIRARLAQTYLPYPIHESKDHLCVLRIASDLREVDLRKLVKRKKVYMHSMIRFRGHLPQHECIFYWNIATPSSNDMASIRKSS